MNTKILNDADFCNFKDSLRLCEDPSWPTARIVDPTTYDIVDFVSVSEWGVSIQKKEEWGSK